MTQYEPTKIIRLNFPPAPTFLPCLVLNSIDSKQLIALVAFLGLLGSSTLAILDIFLYLQLLEATALVSIDMEKEYPQVLAPIRNNVLSKIRLGSTIPVLSSIFFLLDSNVFACFRHVCFLVAMCYWRYYLACYFMLGIF